MLKKYLVTISVSSDVNNFCFESLNKELAKAGFENKMKYFGDKERCKLLDGQYLKFSEEAITEIMKRIHLAIKSTNKEIKEDEYVVVIILFTECLKHNN